MYAYASNNPYVFWDPTGFEKARLQFGVPSLADLTRLPPLRAAVPNFDLDYPDYWHYSMNQRIIDLPAGIDVQRAISAVEADLATFHSFNPGNIATVDVRQGIAQFNLLGAKGLASDWVAMNDNEVAVALSHWNGVQSAVTLGDHQLEGIRIWYASQTGPSQIAITTAAFEHPRGPANAFGSLFSSGDQRAVWDNYFRNIDQKYFGGMGQAQPFLSVWQTPRMINPFVNYVDPRSRQ